MGGCFSLPDPALQNPPNGQPPQPGAAPVAKSLCQSIRDLFMKCLFSRWCLGGFDCSTVNTTWGNHPALPNVPQEEEDLARYSHYRRSCSLGDIKECKKKELMNADEFDVASNENKKNASDLFQRWELQMTEVKSRTGSGSLTAMALNKYHQDSDEIISNPSDETESSSEEELTNVKEITPATREKRKGAASAVKQFEFGGTSGVDTNVVGGAGTVDSAVERKYEDPSKNN